jgi:hypothetical protein
MTTAFLTDRNSALSIAPAPNLRRQIDKSVTRALFDPCYAQRLLTDPSIALEETGCPPQQFVTLRSIRAVDVVDFARQAHALFWRAEPKSSYLEEELPLAVAAR